MARPHRPCAAPPQTWRDGSSWPRPACAAWTRASVLPAPRASSRQEEPPVCYLPPGLLPDRKSLGAGGQGPQPGHSLSPILWLSRQLPSLGARTGGPGARFLGGPELGSLSGPCPSPALRGCDGRACSDRSGRGFGRGSPASSGSPPPHPQARGEAGGDWACGYLAPLREASLREGQGGLPRGGGAPQGPPHICPSGSTSRSHHYPRVR